MADQIPNQERKAFEREVYVQYFVRLIQESLKDGVAKISDSALTPEEVFMQDILGKYVDSDVELMWFGWKAAKGLL